MADRLAALVVLRQHVQLAGGLVEDGESAELLHLVHRADPLARLLHQRQVLRVDGAQVRQVVALDATCLARLLLLARLVHLHVLESREQLPHRLQMEGVLRWEYG